MSKEMKVILFVLITMVLNILAPILMIDMYKDYTAKSFIIGEPQDVIKIENLDVKDYVFQENLSNMNFVETSNENEYVVTYYFGATDFDSSENNYLIFINDYMLTITDLETRAITGEHIRYFKDINGEICNEVDFEIRFEFYTNYSYLIVKINTEDITYFNGFRENPGFVLTLSKVNYSMSGNIYGDSTIGGETELPENTYRVRFNYLGLTDESATFDSSWYISNGSFCKNVLAGDVIGELPNYTAYNVTVYGWYYHDNNGEKVSINSSSIMPSYEIIICPSYMTYEEPVITGQTHTITFTCPSTARVISYDDWTLTDGVYTKEVKGGNSIGVLPNITITSGFAFSYWYYINADGYQVMVNSGTQMPSYDITLLYAVSTNGSITI